MRTILAVAFAIAYAHVAYVLYVALRPTKQKEAHHHA